MFFGFKNKIFNLNMVVEMESSGYYLKFFYPNGYVSELKFMTFHNASESLDMISECLSRQCVWLEIQETEDGRGITANSSSEYGDDYND